ncbi:MAG TPA: lysophospholipid acyltransferase family protein [Candidatus Angelobacter sp.]
MIPFLRMVMAATFMVVVIPLAALFVFPWTLLTRNAAFLYWIGMKIARIAVWLTGTKVQIQGLDKIDPAGTYIFMSNHVSNLDGAILAPRIPRRTSVLAKKELWRVPVLAQALTLASIVPVERQNREAAIQSIKSAAEVMRKGLNMMVFPEGTRSLDGQLQSFRKGPFYLAAETGFPIVPVTMVNTFEMMPKGNFTATGGTAIMVFHSPIDPKNFTSREELMTAVAEAIRSDLPPEQR